MAISLKPQHLNRYRQIAWLFVKYGRSDLVKESGLEGTLAAEQRVTPKEAAKADELADDLEKLGPTFVKLGQLMSTRIELMPQAYLDALARLEDKVERFPFHEVEKIVCSELGVRMSNAFSDFDVTPMAAASLGQVHRARLRDGRQVAVKVQRPGIRDAMFEDLDALDEIAEFLDTQPAAGERYGFWIMPGLPEQPLQLLLAMSEGRGYDAADIAIKVGDRKEDFAEKEFKHRISQIVAQPQGATVEQMQVGRLVLEVTQASAENGIRVPPELTMLGKTLLNLDQVGRTIEPSFDPNASIRRNAAQIMQQRLMKSLSPGNLFSGVLELKDLLQRLPARLNKIIDAIANNEMKISVDAIDEKTLVIGFQKVANRITVGLIIAALIVGAAMLMRVETSFRIWGYPGLAILLFLAAAGAGVFLLINILFYDKSHDE